MSDSLEQEEKQDLSCVLDKIAGRPAKKTVTKADPIAKEPPCIMIPTSTSQLFIEL